MSQTWSSKSRHQVRSPAPARTPTTPSHLFLPPSHYAAAAGLTYPTNRKSNTTPTPNLIADTIRSPPLVIHQPNVVASDPCAFNSNSSHRASRVPRSHKSSGHLRDKRKSQAEDLGLLEAQLLPSLRDTIDRMTRPPSRVDLSISSDVYCPALLERSPSCSSSSITSSTRAKTPINPPQLKPILKSRPRTPGKDFTMNNAVDSNMSCSPVPNRSLRTGRIPLKLSSKYSAQPIKSSFQNESGPSNANHNSNLPVAQNVATPRIGRARSRTDPGSKPRDLIASQTVNSHPTAHCHSNIPRRTDNQPISTSRYNSRKQPIEDSGSDIENRIETEALHHRRLYVANAVVLPSASSGSEKDLTPVAKSRLPTLSSRHDSPGVEKKSPRFGLGFGFADYGTKLKGMFADTPRLTSETSPPNEGDSERASEYSCDTSPSISGSCGGISQKDQQSDIYHSPHEFENEDANRRRKEELLGLVEDFNFKKRDSQHYFDNGDDSDFSEREGFLAISGSRDHINSRMSEEPSHLDVSDSGSEYSFEEGDQRTKYSVPPQTGSISHRSFALKSPDDAGRHRERQSSPRIATSEHYDLRYPTQNSSILSADGVPDSNMPCAPDRSDEIRYSSELSRLLATSTAAAARQRQAFGLPTSVSGCGAGTSEGGELSHTESYSSSFVGDNWRDDYEDFTIKTTSLLENTAEPRIEPTHGFTDTQLLPDGDDHSEYSDQNSIINDESSVDGSSSYPSQSSISRGSIYPSAAEFIQSNQRQAADEEDEDPSDSDSCNSWEAFRELVLSRYGEVEICRQQLIWELTDTEADFVSQLQNMVKVFIRPLRVRNSKAWITGVPPDVARLFDWLEDIVHLHSQILASLISSRRFNHDSLELIGDSLRIFIPKFEIYQPFLVKLEFVAALIEQLVNDQSSDFGEFVRLQEASRDCTGWSLEKYLVEPVNRLARYPDYFRRLLQVTPKVHTDYVSTFSLLYSSKLVIRVLSDVKDQEDEYELVKDLCTRIQNLPPGQLPRRERRLLFRGASICCRVQHDSSTTGLNTKAKLREFQDSPDVESNRHAKLSKALKGWRGRSSSVKSTTSTVASFKSFKTAPSSFDLDLGPLGSPGSTPSGISSLPINVHSFVFTDLLLLAIPIEYPGVRAGSSNDDETKWRILDDYGISRILSVCERVDSSSELILDVIPLAFEELNTVAISSYSSTITIALSQFQDRNAIPMPISKDTISPFRQSCQHTLKSISSLKASSDPLNHGCSSHLTSENRNPILSILASGLPLPKSPSMQAEGAAGGIGSDAKQQEREERGWWSLRFHQILQEVQKQDVPIYI
ncbi:hypothetical protein BJ138DRAFT_1078560 [Hygrophoropsis aurantiaca]|uniref:Uncharacterized protein n=1 Tax=Hygrophoropsis aurantiaca TaxID=72124 RepID=A0ACB8APL8_9AGAM|nr:hypothetical protein BJ138DRAFT_1078560 [Hygrophoropsis aurantiaca]